MASEKSILDTHTIGDLSPANKALVTLNQNGTLGDALGLMQKHGVLSVPVIDATVDPKKEGHVIGILSVLDIMTAIVFQPVFEQYRSNQLEKLDKELLEAVKKSKTFDLPAKELVGVSQESLTALRFLLSTSDPIRKLLAPFSEGLHRILVRSEKDAGKFSYCSQSDLIKFLKGLIMKDEFYQLTKQEIGHLDLVSSTYANPSDPDADYFKSLDTTESKVVNVFSKSSALLGFRRMIIEGELSALPVVDDQGKLIATLSSTDVRGLTKDNFHLILLPVTEFLLKVHNTSSLRTPITCTAEDSLATVIERIVQHKLHRIWVVDDDDHPIGVIALSDIIRKFSLASQ